MSIPEKLTVGVYVNEPSAAKARVPLAGPDINKVSKVKVLDKLLRNNLHILNRRLDEIQMTKISSHVFGRVQLNRNNAYYEFLLRVCELIHNMLLPESDEGDYSFKDILQEEKLMSRVFERFLRNFYKIEQDVYSVSSEYISWDGAAITTSICLFSNST